MSSTADLPYMPTWIDRLQDATKTWSHDARLVYYELLFAHWRERGILPNDLQQLQVLARVEAWEPDRFRAAWAVIQGEGTWKRPKFEADEFGLFNARNRQIYAEKLMLIREGHRGALKQHGCRSCREAGHKVNLGDGMVRHCPKCGRDFWENFPEVPWMPELLPAPKRGHGGEQPGGQGGGQGGGRGGSQAGSQGGNQIEIQNAAGEEAQASSYATEVEAAFLGAMGTARPLSPSEGAQVVEWFDAGVPLHLVVEVIHEVLRRKRGRKPRMLTYFRDAVAERLEELQKLKAAAGKPPRASANGFHPIASQTWDAIQVKLRESLPDREWRDWFAPLAVEAETDGRLVVRCPTEDFVAVIEADYRATLNAAAGGVTVVFSNSQH